MLIRMSCSLSAMCRFITEFHTDMMALNCLTPTDEPKATDYIPQMISMIEQLIESHHAYEVEGNVWFSVESFVGYGRLSGRKLVGVFPSIFYGAMCAINSYALFQMLRDLPLIINRSAPAFRRTTGQERGWQ